MSEIGKNIGRFYCLVSLRKGIRYVSLVTRSCTFSLCGVDVLRDDLFAAPGLGTSFIPGHAQRVATLFRRQKPSANTATPSGTTNASLTPGMARAADASNSFTEAPKRVGRSSGTLRDQEARYLR